MSVDDPLAYARTKEPLVKEPKIGRSRVSPIWILPVVAILIAAWLGYTAFAEKGPTITITFKTAAGLEAGKTRIKYHDIELGTVRRIDPAPDLSHVIVSAQMNKTAQGHLRQGTHFWVVRPRFSLTNLSGLETLVSGSYIEMDPGAGPAIEQHFTGLEQPPVVRSDEPGTSFIVTTDKIGSLSSGAPVFLHGVAVGEVIGYTFDGTQNRIPVRIFVKEPYDSLIHDGTQFWNASGISVALGSGGVNVQMDSLQAVLLGGIAFETPRAARTAAPAKADTQFVLYDNRAAAAEAGYTDRVRVMVEFSGSVRGLDVGAPVEVQGIPVGRVVDFHLVVDAAAHTVRVPVVLEVDAARLGIINQPPGQFGKHDLMRSLVALGMRAQLRSSSLITGGLYVAFDFFPNAPPAEIVETGKYPQLPTVPAEMESLTRSVSQTLDKLAALPLDQIVADARSALVAAQHLMSDADTRSAPLLQSLHQTSEAADIVLKSMGNSYGSNSRVHAEIASLLAQLQETANSVKMLADYLEQHPESLIRGKSASR